MARGRATSATTRLGKLEERIAELRRERAADQGPVVVYADDDEQVVEAYVAERERTGVELVVVVRSLARRPEGRAAPWA